MLISKTPVVSSGEVNVNLASHLLNFPAIVVDDFRWKLHQLSTGLISKNVRAVLGLPFDHR